MSSGAPIEPSRRRSTSVSSVESIIAVTGCVVVVVAVVLATIVVTDAAIDKRPQRRSLQRREVIHVHGIVGIESRLQDHPIVPGIVCPPDRFARVRVPTRVVVVVVVPPLLGEVYSTVVVGVEDVPSRLATPPSTRLDPDAVVGVAPDDQCEQSLLCGF